MTNSRSSGWRINLRSFCRRERAFIDATTPKISDDLRHVDVLEMVAPKVAKDG
ncbi:MAG: hypothetical protein ACI8Z0_001570 [Lentimonas sp.]